MTVAGHRPDVETDGSCRRHPDVLYCSIVDGVGDLIVAFDDAGTIVFANRASSAILGMEPAELEGRNVLDFIHPDDLERAIRALGMNQNFGAAPGLTAFRLVRADGSPVLVDMTGGHATDDGSRTLYTSSSRVNENRAAMQTTLVNLLEGAPLEVALRPVCDIFTWKSNGSQVGVSWQDGTGGRGAVSTGIDLDLIGDHVARDTPWARVRDTGEAIIDLDLRHLDPARRETAAQLGLASYWIQPVAGAVSEPALITVWTAVGRRPPAGHELGMETARSVVAVILRWAEQQRRLDHAAYHDPLTSLANRKAFFDAVGNQQEGGVVLYCDVDRFKPVNDRYGHAAGDALLQQVAVRLERCVRRDDLVARLGGDEFAILCPSMTPDEAAGLVVRIRSDIGRPFELDGATVTIGMSVGVAHDPSRITEVLLDQADRDLYAEKLAR